MTSVQTNPSIATIVGHHKLNQWFVDLMTRPTRATIHLAWMLPITLSPAQQSVASLSFCMGRTHFASTLGTKTKKIEWKSLTKNTNLVNRFEMHTSKSNSNPSKLCILINSTTLSMNLRRLFVFDRRRPYFSLNESSNPPMAIKTLMPCWRFSATRLNVW